MKLFAYFGFHNLMSMAQTMNLTFTDNSTFDQIPVASQLRVDLLAVAVPITLDPESTDDSPSYAYVAKVMLNGREFKPCAGQLNSEWAAFLEDRCLFKDLVELARKRSFYG